MNIYTIKIGYRKGGSDVCGAYYSFEEAVAALKKMVKNPSDEWGDINSGEYCDEETSYEVVPL